MPRIPTPQRPSMTATHIGVPAHGNMLRIDYHMDGDKLVETDTYEVAFERVTEVNDKMDMTVATAEATNVETPDVNEVSAVADAGGFSFPSGHTQNVFATFGGVFAWTKKVWLKIVCAVLIVLVAFSRMYLGVHTPLDVGVSVVIGVVLLLVLYPVFRDLEAHPNRFYGFLAVLAVLLAAFLLYSYLWPFPDWMFAEEHVVNLVEARHNASILTGALAALTIAYTLDLRRTRFDTRAVWWAQILKVVIGLVVTLALIEGTKAVLGRSDLVTGLRYFLGVLFAAGIWPMTFGWFSRLGKKVTV